MTIPKTPSHHDHDNLNNDHYSLGDTIDKLDELIADRNNPAPGSPSDDTEIPVLNEPSIGDHEIKIPILDDIVETDHHSAEVADMTPTNNISKKVENPATEITPEQLSALVDNMEGKINSELNNLVDILKDTIKDSIMAELRTQLETAIQKINDPHQKIND
jgi:hypothetical protein